jgi:predicted nucleotidyltransferase
MISSHDLKTYIAGAKQRQRQKQILLDDRELLQTVAQKGAEILKTDFAAHKVWLFGSGLLRELIHLESDVDLAVEGLAEASYFRAVSRLLDLNANVSVDLVMLDDASESLRDRIIREGKEL